MITLEEATLEQIVSELQSRVCLAFALVTLEEEGRVHHSAHLPPLAAARLLMVAAGEVLDNLIPELAEESDDSDAD